MGDELLKYSSDGSLVSCPATYEGPVVIREGTPSILSGAFKDCAKVTSVQIPRSVKSVAAGAFSDSCKSLHQIRYDGTMEDWLYLVNWNALLNNWYTLIVSGVVTTYVILPENLTQLRPLVFYYSSITSIFFNDKLQSIGDNAFNKSQLKGAITIPDSVNTIGRYCFLSCKNLTEVNLPSSVVLIGNGAFRYCDKLVAINVDERNPNYCSIDGFLYNKEKTILISAPSGYVGKHTVPDTVTRIYEYAFASFAGHCTVDFSNCKSLEIGQNAFTEARDLEILIREGESNFYVSHGVAQDLLSEVIDFSTVSVEESKLRNAISYNPFRVLGIYVNASSKEQHASLTKMQRYLEVNKSPEMECDFNEVLTPILRTKDQIENANGSIYLPADKFKAALFWIAKSEPLHDIAFGHFKAGNYLKAFEILSKGNSWSSTLNRSTLSLSIGKVSYGIEHLFKLLNDDSLREDFCMYVCGGDYLIDAQDASNIAIDELLKTLNPKELWRYLSNCRTKHPSSLDYLSTKILEKPISSIEIAISNARESYSGNALDNYNAGIKLMSSTKATLTELLELRGISEQRVTNCIDNLANTILQCGINYYNGAHEYDAAKNALSLQEYAESIAIGSIVKDRCKKNTNILRDIIGSLPNKEIYEFSIETGKIFNNYSNNSKDRFSRLFQPSPEKAMKMIRECRPILISAKEKLGASNPNYQELSSNVASVALSIVINAVNSELDKTRITLFYDRSSILKSVRTVLADAWRATLMIQRLDMSKEYRDNKFEQNKKTLCSIMSKFEVYCDPYLDVDLDMRTDDEFFGSCHSIDEWDKYLKNFPNGKHKNEAIAKKEKRIALRKKLLTILWIVFGILALSLAGYFIFQSSNAEERLSKKAIESHNLQYCEDYLMRYPKGIYRGGVLRVMSGMEEEFVKKHFSQKFVDNQVSSYDVNNIKSYYELYKQIYPIGKKRWEVEAYVDINTQYDDYKNLTYNSTMEDYQAFFANHNNTSTSYYKKALADYERKFEWELYKDSYLETGAQPYHAAYGWNYSFGYYDSYSTITVVAPTNSDVIVIVKRNSESGSVAGHVYIRAGRRASIDVPNGTYKPIFYYGKGWKPTKEKVSGAPGAFVKDESYSTISGTEYLYESEVTYTLQFTTNGNLHTRSISENSVF